jgi:hypothetical protein
MELAVDDPELVSDEPLQSFFSTKAGVILRKADARLSSILKNKALTRRYPMLQTELLICGFSGM